MNDITKSMLAECSFNPPAPPEAIQSIREKYPLFPEEHLCFLRASNGLAGFVGEAFLKFWPAEAIVAASPMDDIMAQHAPGIVEIGTDGSSGSYGLDLSKAPPRFVAYSPMDLGVEPVRELGSSFHEFIMNLGKDQAR